MSTIDADKLLLWIKEQIAFYEQKKIRSEHHNAKRVYQYHTDAMRLVEAKICEMRAAQNTSVNTLREGENP